MIKLGPNLDNVSGSGETDADMPNLVSISGDSDDDLDNEEPLVEAGDGHLEDDSESVALATRLERVLSECQPYPGDGPAVDRRYQKGDRRFIVKKEYHDLYQIYDRVQGFEAYIHETYLRWDKFSVGKWYAERCAHTASSGFPGRKLSNG